MGRPLRAGKSNRLREKETISESKKAQKKESRALRKDTSKGGRQESGVVPRLAAFYQLLASSFHSPSENYGE